MKKYWFKNKTYGWGWTPASWEGWLVLAIYVAGNAGAFIAFDQSPHELNDVLMSFSPYLLVSTAALIYICYRFGEKPVWRWGKKK